MSAWGTWRSLPLRRKVLVGICAPLWLPVAFVAWLESAAAVSAGNEQ